MTAIIVDDEKNSREVLEIMLSKYCPEVVLLTCCASAEQTFEVLKTHKPDVIFLDIEMPDMNGFEMLERIQLPEFEVIFTTAYNEYAIKAIKHSALDYLLKPIDKDELIAAVQKASRGRLHYSDSRIHHLLELLELKKPVRRFAVSTIEGLIMLNADDIIYCESIGPYCKFYFNGKEPLVTSKTLKDAEHILIDCGFFRIHHSYIINMKCIEKYIRGDGGEVVLQSGTVLPVARTRKNDFLLTFTKL